MSHSPTLAERAWDYGMINEDWIALPVCEPAAESYWSAGDLRGGLSYWHERNWARWRSKPYVNYFRVRDFRSVPHSEKARKGTTEGSELSIVWKGVFSTREGVVETVDAGRVTVRRNSDGHRYTWTIGEGMKVFVSPGDALHDNQLFAGEVTPIASSGVTCSGTLPKGHIPSLLKSRERTQRFTGVKLARLRKDNGFRDVAEELSQDGEEDIYVRLEACSYVTAVCSVPARTLFGEHLAGSDPQTRLETVIALGEAGTPEAIRLLCGILDDTNRPYFLRSAAAWSLSRSSDAEAAARLVHAFGDVDLDIREEALAGLVAVGGPSFRILLEKLTDTDEDIAAGCADALRRLQPLPKKVVDGVAARVRSEDPAKWAVWLLGNLPREQVGPLIAEMQESSPKVHYAVVLLWSFVESWIARRWELNPRASDETP